MASSAHHVRRLLISCANRAATQRCRDERWLCYSWEWNQPRMRDVYNWGRCADRISTCSLSFGFFGGALMLMLSV